MKRKAKPAPAPKPAAEKLILVSSNPNKGIEAERILGVPVLRVSIILPEIQAATVEDITRYKLEVARTKGYGRLVVEGTRAEVVEHPRTREIYLGG